MSSFLPDITNIFESAKELDYRSMMSDLDFKKAANYIDYIAEKVKTKQINSTTAAERIDRYFSTLARGRSLTTKFDLTKAFTQRASSQLKNGIVDFSKTIVQTAEKPKDLLIWAGSWTKQKIIPVAEKVFGSKILSVTTKIAKISPVGFVLGIIADLAIPITLSPADQPGEFMYDQNEYINDPEAEAIALNNSKIALGIDKEPATPATPAKTPAPAAVVVKKTTTPTVTIIKANINNMEDVITKATSVITDLSATLEDRLTYKLTSQQTAETTAGKREKGPFLKMTLYFSPANNKPKLLTSYILGTIATNFTAWQNYREGKITDLVKIAPVSVAIPSITVKPALEVEPVKPLTSQPPPTPAQPPQPPPETPKTPVGGFSIYLTPVQRYAATGGSEYYKFTDNIDVYETATGRHVLYDEAVAKNIWNQIKVINRY